MWCSTAAPGTAAGPTGRALLRATATRLWVEIPGIGSHNDWQARVAAVGVTGAVGEYVSSGLVQRSPSAIRGLTLTPGDGQIEAAWDPPADAGNPPIWEYIVSYRLDGSPTWQQFRQPAADTDRTFTGLTNGRLYHVRVSAFNGARIGTTLTLSAVPSAEGGDPVEDTPPAPGPLPQNLTLTPGDGKIDVSWDAPADRGDPPLVGYWMHWREAGPARQGPVVRRHRRHDPAHHHRSDQRRRLRGVGHSRKRPVARTAGRAEDGHAAEVDRAAAAGPSSQRAPQPDADAG